MEIIRKEKNNKNKNRLLGKKAWRTNIAPATDINRRRNVVFFLFLRTFVVISLWFSKKRNAKRSQQVDICVYSIIKTTLPCFPEIDLQWNLNFWILLTHCSCNGHFSGFMFTTYHDDNNSLKGKKKERHDEQLKINWEQEFSIWRKNFDRWKFARKCFSTLPIAKAFFVLEFFCTLLPIYSLHPSVTRELRKKKAHSTAQPEGWKKIKFNKVLCSIKGSPNCSFSSSIDFFIPIDDSVGAWNHFELLNEK